jgi:hypothetical protein
VSATRVVRRAPRLGPQDRIAPLMTRTGRWRQIDPLRPQPLPGVAKLVATVAWVVLVEESLRRAWVASRRDGTEPGR